MFVNYQHSLWNVNFTLKPSYLSWKVPLTYDNTVALMTLDFQILEQKQEVRDCSWIKRNKVKTMQSHVGWQSQSWKVFSVSGESGISCVGVLSETPCSRALPVRLLLKTPLCYPDLSRVKPPSNCLLPLHKLPSLPHSPVLKRHGRVPLPAGQLSGAAGCRHDHRR